MRLVLDSPSHLNLVRQYGNGAIVVGEQRITRPFILTPLRLILDWSAHSLETLGQAELEPLFATEAAVILLGAGERQMFASAAVRASFRARHVALECMTLGAACRTYNILAGEDRTVAAGLFP
ncbi:MAG: MTH938/NDUFAF3 family protein [Steroidobacteraceae bacterium]